MIDDIRLSKRIRRKYYIVNKFDPQTFNEGLLSILPREYRQYASNNTAYTTYTAEWILKTDPSTNKDYFHISIVITVYMPRLNKGLKDSLRIKEYINNLECHENDHVMLAEKMGYDMKNGLEDMIVNRGYVSNEFASSYCAGILDAYAKLHEDFDNYTYSGCNTDYYLYSPCKIQCNMKKNRKRKPISITITRDRIEKACLGKTRSEGGLNVDDMGTYLNVSYRTRRRLQRKFCKLRNLWYN